MEDTFGNLSAWKFTAESIIYNKGEHVLVKNGRYCVINFVVTS